MKMNKLSYLLMGFAALSFAACSSDEPTVAPTPDGEGTTLYLNVNITDADNARSRAAGFDEDGNAKDPAEEGDYIFGDENEHNVNRADFFFFDGAGNFVTKANVWQASNETQAPNIEYMGTNTLVLRNLKKGTLPEWVITVLNAPIEFVNKVQASNLTISQVRKELMKIGESGNFCMSTTSFVDATIDADRYDNANYGATKLFEKDFTTEPVTAMPTNAVKIYVERLAAKFTIEGLDENGIYEVDVTLAGEDNGPNVEGQLPSANEKVYVRIFGYGLTGQESDSYLTKNIEGFATKAPWTGWNNPNFFRSYWGMSPNYGNANPVLKYTTFAEASTSVNDPLYGYETTNTVEAITTENGSLVMSNVTNIIFTARVYATRELALTGGEDTGLDLVEFNGVYFTKAQYLAYALGRLYQAGGLRYFKNETVTTEETEAGTVIKYEYTPVDMADFAADFVQPENAETGEIVISYNGTEQLYVKPADYTSGAYTKVGKAYIDAELADFNASTKAYAYTGGAMYYNVPVEHLLGKNLKNNYKATELGEYGIVRNHWYQLKVGKVVRLGHGVFNPDPDNGEEIKPNDPNNETYALAAQINILSWKVVKQEVDL